MTDRTHLTRLITLALATCAVTWAFAAGALARPAAPNAPTAPSASTAPAYQPAIGDHLKTPDRAAVDRNLASLRHGGKGRTVIVASGDDNTGTIALIAAIAAMLVALAAATLIVVRPQPPALHT